MTKVSSHAFQSGLHLADSFTIDEACREAAHFCAKRASTHYRDIGTRIPSQRTAHLNQGAQRAVQLAAANRRKRVTRLTLTLISTCLAGGLIGVAAALALVAMGV